MAIRIVGVDIPQNKCGEVSLTYIYGIGRSSAKKILAEAGVDPTLKVEDWTDDQAAKIREIIGAKYKVEGDLRSETQLNIKRLMDIGCYRGVRHRIGLPVRGQSTTVTTDIHQTFDVQLCFRTKITFYFVLCTDDLTDLSCLVIRPILYLDAWVYACLCQDLLCA